MTTTTTTTTTTTAPPPKKILNNPADSVAEFMDGLLLQYPNHLCKLANHHVVLLQAAQRDVHRVQLIAGGGSGHEPSHAGWIGKGMLSGAVCGGIFASPSVWSILAAIRALHHHGTSSDTDAAAATADADAAGIVLIIKNYTGDRLNFGLAAERALQEGMAVDMVVVADDCALPRAKGITGARGVAGTVLVHKVAGAAAAAGYTRQRVVALARQTASRLGSLGIALDSVTVPGAERVNDRLDSATIEIGLGIHGEAGRKQSKLLSADAMAQEMIATIREYGRVVEEPGDDDGIAVAKIVPLFDAGDEVCILVNNLGGTSNFEMSILARSIVTALESSAFGVKVTRVFVGSYMTSFNMHGASLTILNTTGQSEILELLDAPTNAPAWSACDVWNLSSGDRPSATEVPEVVVDEAKVVVPQPPLNLGEIDFAATAQKMIACAVEKLAEAEPLLTQYDTIVGDGDCGITMKRGATHLRELLHKGTLPTDHPVPLFSTLADTVSASMGGTSGVLLELMFRKISSTLSHVDGTIGVAELCRAVQAGVDAVSLYGGAQVGSRTMLDALVPAAATLVATSGNLAEAAVEARRGADTTATMTSASAGRSNYLSEAVLEGTPDPGAVAVAIVFESMAN